MVEWYDLNETSLAEGEDKRSIDLVDDDAGHVAHAAQRFRIALAAAVTAQAATEKRA